MGKVTDGSLCAMDHVFRPRGACRDIFSDRSEEILLCGPAGTGKSRAALEKLLLVMLKYPYSRGLIVRKTQVSLGSTALETWRRHVSSAVLPRLGCDARWDGQPHQDHE